MSKTTLRLNEIWNEVRGEEKILKIKKSKKSFDLLYNVLEMLTKEIMIQAIKSAKESGVSIIREKDMENAIKIVLGPKGDENEL